MKLKHTLAVLALGLAVSTLPCHAACALASFTGPYGFVLNGVDGSTVTALVGQMISDGKGHITSGSETVSSGGAITSNVSLTGTYTLTSGCTGTVKITASGFPTATYAVSVVSSGSQVEMVESDSGTGVSGYALARGNSMCTLAGTKATYGFHGSSTITLSGDTETGNFVVVNGGLTLLAITTNSGAVQTTTVNKR